VLAREVRDQPVSPGLVVARWSCGTRSRIDGSAQRTSQSGVSTTCASASCHDAAFDVRHGSISRVIAGASLSGRVERTQRRPDAARDQCAQGAPGSGAGARPARSGRRPGSARAPARSARRALPSPRRGRRARRRQSWPDASSHRTRISHSACGSMSQGLGGARGPVRSRAWIPPPASLSVSRAGDGEGDGGHVSRASKQRAARRSETPHASAPGLRELAGAPQAAPLENRGMRAGCNSERTHS